MNTKLNLKLNGKDTKLRTHPLRKEKLASIIPLTESAFNTYVYLDTRRPHPLIMGSSTERRKFFESFFSLDKLNAEKKLIQQSLAELGRTKAAHSALLQEFEATKSNLKPKVEREQLKSDLLKESVKLSTLKSKSSRLQEILRVCMFYQNAEAEINTIWSANAGHIDHESYQELIKTNQWNIKHNSEGLADALAWEKYQEDLLAHQESIKNLSAEAKALIEEYSVEDVIEKCRKSKERALLIKRDLSDVKAKYAELDLDKPAKVEKATGDKESLNEALVALRHKLKHAEKFNQGVCDTCGQSVAVADKDKLKRSITKLSAELQAITDYEDYKRDYLEWKSQQELKTSLEARVELLKGKYEKYKKEALLLPELVSIVKKPKPHEGKKLESKVKQRMLDEDKERERLLKFLEPHVEMIVQYQNLTDKQKEAGAIAEKLQEAIIRSQEKCSKLESLIENQEAIVQTLKRQKAKLDTYEAELADEKNIRLLLNAYDDRGMKRLAIEAISSRLVQTINTYSKMVFPEDYRFEFVWTSSQLSFLCHRMVNVKGKVRPDTSDIRKLSGAESSLFSLVLIIALLSFVPDSRRCNLLILDEATANLSEENQQAMGEILKVMLQIIPSIILVTPRNSEMYEGANNFTVIKENGSSTIVSGHPSTVSKK